MFRIFDPVVIRMAIYETTGFQKTYYLQFMPYSKGISVKEKKQTPSSRIWTQVDSFIS